MQKAIVLYFEPLFLREENATGIAADARKGWSV